MTHVQYYRSERTVVMPTLGWNVAEGGCQCSSARNCKVSLASRFVAGVWGIWREEGAGENLPLTVKGRREGFLWSEAIPPLSMTWILLCSCCRESRAC